MVQTIVVASKTYSEIISYKFVQKSLGTSEEDNNIILKFLIGKGRTFNQLKYQ